MKDVGLNIVEALEVLSKMKDHPLRIVECGTIRNPVFEGHDDGLGTYHVAKWLRDQEAKHEFYSFELSEGSIQNCKAFLRQNGKLDELVRFGLGDASLLLEHFRRPIDLCYLDAGADPLENLEQYRYASKWLRTPGIIIIDDVFDPRNANRGLVTVPYAQTVEGRKVACLDNRQALISFGFDYPLPQGAFWL